MKTTENINFENLSRQSSSFLDSIHIKTPTDLLSKLAHDIGVKRIENVTINHNSFTFYLERIPKLVNNQDLQNLTTFKIIKEGTSIILKFEESSNNIKINEDREIQLFFNNQYSTFAENEVDNLTQSQSTELANLLILFDLVINPNNPVSQITYGGTCDLISISAYPTKSRAIHKLKQQVKDFLASHPDCTKIGDIDTGCLFGD